MAEDLYLVTERELQSATVNAAGELEFTRENGQKINAGKVRGDITPEAIAARDAAVSARDAAVAAKNAAQAVGSTNDTIMTNVAKDPASQFGAQLSATMAEIVEPTLLGQRLTARSAADTLKSQTDHLVKYEDTATVLEPWDDLSAWSASAMTVAENKLYSDPTGASGVIRHAFLPGAKKPFRLRGTITNVAGGSGGVTAVSVALSKDEASAGYTSGNRFGIGFFGSGQAFIYIGSGLGGSGAVAQGTGAAAAGEWTYNFWGDGDYMSVALISPDGNTVYRYRWNVPSAGMKSVIITGNDTRGESGHAIGPLGWRYESVSITPRTPYEPAVRAEGRSTDSNGQGYYLVEPAGFDSRKVYPLVISAHGNTQYELHLTFSPAREAFIKALAANGFMYGAHNMHGSLWGAQQAVTDIETFYQLMKSKYPIGPVILLGESMGTLAVLNAVARGQIPVAGVGTIDGVMNLGWNWTNGMNGSTPDSDLIKAAYGIASDGSDYAAKTDGYDPMLRRAGEFRGVPMRFMSSPADTRIPKAFHADMMAAKLAGVTPDLTVATHAGGHTADSAFVVSDWMPFFKRVAGLPA